MLVFENPFVLLLLLEATGAKIAPNWSKLVILSNKVIRDVAAALDKFKQQFHKWKAQSKL